MTLAGADRVKSKAVSSDMVIFSMLGGATFVVGLLREMDARLIFLSWL